MPQPNLFLDSSNAPDPQTTPLLPGQDGDSFDFLPLGVTGDGEAGLKVLLVGSSAPTPASLAEATPTITSVNSNGTVAAGAVGLTFVLSTDFAGTILGATYSGTTTSSQTIPVPSGYKLGAVAYTISAGSMLIVKTVPA